MNDPTHPESDTPSAAPPVSSSSNVLSERLRVLRNVLREGGVVRVIAAYEKNILTVAFLNAEESPIVPPNVERVSSDLAKVFGFLVKRRCAVWSPKETSSGTFSWRLGNDTLEHRHTVTFNGL